jgi:uncharacterized protein (DUF927 family)
MLDDARALSEKSKPVPIIPVPEDAPPCRWRHPKYGEPVATWAYRDAEGRLVGYAARVEYDEAGETKKDVYPITYCRISRANGDFYSWRARGVPAPRPLYNLPALLVAPDAPVIVCEGEKKAEAVQRLFPGCVGTASIGGSKAPRKSDWTTLSGRAVVIWPDNDEPGRRYAQAVAALVTAAGAASVAIVGVPESWPKKWDLADGVPDGIDPKELKALLESAQRWTAPASPDALTETAALSYMSFGRFQMNARGLFYDSNEGPLWLSAPFEVLAQTRDRHGSEWGLLLRWRDADGTAHDWAMPREALGGRGEELWRYLLRNGLTIASSTSSRSKLADYLGTVRVDRRARSVPRIGWHRSDSGSVFVLPDETFGDVARERVLWQTETRKETLFKTSGSVESWRREIGQRCTGNSRLVMAVSTAFAPPLLEPANEESGGLHVVGKSRDGKTTVLRVAGSVWGGGGINGYIRAWRATSNGLEGIAEGHSDGLLCLDEMGQVDAREAGEVAYMLANGAGKGRAGRDGSARRPAQWRLLFLSSGELTLADKMAEAGKRSRAGQEVRLVDVPADAGAAMGIFENLQGAASPGEFAEILHDAVGRHYGNPIRAFLRALTERLAADRDGLQALLGKNRQEFMAMHLPSGASPQVRSVCGRFALIAAAGNLATVFGITGWPDDESERAAGICFRAWLDRRGNVGDQEIESGIRQVIRFLEEHGNARFELIEDIDEQALSPVTAVTADSNVGLPRKPIMISQVTAGTAVTTKFPERTLNRAGFRRQTVTGLWQYMALPEAWRTDMTKGYDARALARAMVERGLILPDKRGTPARQVSVRGFGKPRLYVFEQDIFERYEDAIAETRS